VRQKIVLFGGYNQDERANGGLVNDTWEWDMTNGWVKAA
jgi:hypothetical protein